MTPNVRIVGGVSANAYSIPSVVYINRLAYNSSSGQYQKYICAGTLIRRNAVLTSAYCVDPFGFVATSLYPTFESTIFVYAGAYDVSFSRTTLTAPSPALTLRVSRIIRVNNIF